VAAPKYLERDPTLGQVKEIIATETGPASEVIVSTSPSGKIDPSLLPSSSGNFVQVLIDFGHEVGGGEGDTATVTVAAAWVTATSIILCNFPAIASPDHDPEDAVIEDLTASAGNIVPGVSFDITAYAPNGTWGRYYVNATGQ
jgi:hypothetical protein